MEWSPLTQFVVTTIVSIVAGGFAGAVYTNWQTDRRSRATSTRLLAALSADTKRVQAIASHNIRVAQFHGDHVPRAFIPLPTATYELLLFNAQVSTITQQPLLDRLMVYLEHAYHVNSMIENFRRLDLEQPATTSTDVNAKKRHYLEGISKYSAEGVQASLSELQKALPS